MSITIVTAFFDIGRGNWSSENGHPNYLERSTDKYFKYFSNLALLENELVVFTSTNFVSKIREIRGSKPTTIIEICLDEKFHECIEAISKIQNDVQFQQKIGIEQLKNPEYWSAEYVLVNNLKSYFVKKAIKNVDIKTSLVAWVDFGYCRNLKTLNNLKKWDFPFIQEKIHFFSIQKDFEISEENVKNAIFNNQPFIIGGVIVATPKKWLVFSNLVYECQKDMLDNNIIDDDQGVYLTTVLKQPNLFEINYLGKDRWFDVFKKYDQSSKLSVVDQFKKFIGCY